MQGVVLRCAGSAMICCFGTSGSCLLISACSKELVTTQIFSGGMTPFRRSTVC